MGAAEVTLDFDFKLKKKSFIVTILDKNSYPFIGSLWDVIDIKLKDDIACEGYHTDPAYTHIQVYGQPSPDSLYVQ